jgi:hypothetical protein
MRQVAARQVAAPVIVRAGSYRLDGLIARFGAAAALPNVLMAQASCERRADCGRPCAARSSWRR